MHKPQLQKNDSFTKKITASSFLLKKIDVYLSDLQLSLDKLLDKRLVGTFYHLFVAILVNRNRSMGLLLSELGGFICGFDHAPAGTKRISNLLRSKKWSSTVLDDFLFARSKKRIEQLQQIGKRPLLIWDDSKIEKPESWLTEGLCSVESSKGKRLTKVKKGFYHPPVSRICVPGYRWTASLLSALGEAPSVCQMSWWTTRGKYKENGSNIIFKMLEKLHKSIGKGVLHVFDRGYANAWTVEWLTYFQQDFLVRWKKNHLLIHPDKGKKKTHLLARSFKAQQRKIVFDSQRKVIKSISIAWTKVQHPDFVGIDLSLVILRDRKNHQSPLYLLTSIQVSNLEQAWEMCHVYMHRWNIEQTFRFCKTELAIESPRLWFFENTCKLLGMVALIYDFLIHLINNWGNWIQLILKRWCHRTGNRYRKASVPIYRLRVAIHNIIWTKFAQNSG
ncbi:MAG: transposase [Bacteroidota bacterium]